MSSFNTHLSFKDTPVTKYSVIQCNYSSFHQLPDDKSRPSTLARGGNIMVQISTPPDNLLLKWMFDGYKMRSGMITFYKIDEETAFQRVAFIDAYCVEHHTTYSAFGSLSMVTTIMIAAKSLSINGIDHNNDLPDALVSTG
ncbi:type VI secretion system tube protein TssD [Pedobacter sp. NJ-S-72]